MKKCKMCMHNHRRAAVQKVSLSLIYIYIHSLSVPQRWSKNALHFTKCCTLIVEFFLSLHLSLSPSLSPCHTRSHKVVPQKIKTNVSMEISLISQANKKTAEKCVGKD